ncbi:hypothetical protein PVL30_002443 [Lodderomyces elongisporus]|uniref:uncharacterized protein n=1 Tax=Lodderomyces elongisporus TaxID=36914 RepID=UPI0029244FB7|nr:uncharacterized protein PVL30_002443 [Lodderomyces elongisporus]WLF78701.1 hypothetical protein PVL30_002443 [Lodderomyces elongisporus]
MGILTTQDKEKIKRAVPKTSNKVIDATVARLYIAYPDPTKWVFTGLMGAIALVDDLVGHTFFLKMVDITGHRGVIWDQELYVNFEYNQDRKFFHTFEIEDCLVGLLFEDTNDATHFHKRVTTRQKHGSSATVKNKNAIALKEKVGPKTHNAPGPRGEFMDVNTAQRQRRAKGVLYYDDVPPPEWRSLYAELEAAGITEDMIVDNRQFIKDYIAQQGGPLVGLEPPVPRKYQSAHERALNNEAPASSSASTTTTTTTEHASFTKHKKAPPPAPPTQTPSSSSPAPGAPGISNIASSGYGHSTPESHSSMSPSTETPDPENEAGNEPAKFKPVFRVPPMDKLPQRAASQTSSSTNTERPLPAPPSAAPSFNPQPTTTSAPHSAATSQPAQTRKPFAVPPPFVPNPAQQAPQAYQTPQQTNQGPPAPPSRGGAPPPPPRAGMSNSGSPAPPPRNAGLTPMKTGGAGPPPPPPPARGSRGPAPPPPPSRSSAIQQQHQQQQQQQQTAHSTPPPLHQRPQVAIPIQTQNPNQPGLTSPPPPPRPGQFTSPPPPTRPAQALPQQTQVPAPIPNSFPTQTQTQTQAQTQPSQSAPPPPPLPQSMSAGGGAVPPPPPPPPPPAMSTGSAPPAPPPPPTMSTGAAPMSNGGSLPEATGDAGRDALLASIRGAGIGALKKTDKSQLDKPSVLLQEARGEPVSTQPTGGASGGGGAPPGSLADALSAALSKRKEKVAHSDDEDDEW